MMLTAAFLKMAQNNAWANKTLYQAATGLSQNGLSDPAPGFFPNLGRTLNHIYEVDLYYLDALLQRGRGRQVYEREDTTSLSDLADLQSQSDLRLIGFCKALKQSMLDDLRRTERPEGIVEETVGALLLHLFQHQIHHRGQAHVQLQTLGVAPPQLDDFYLSHGRAPTAQEYWP